MFGVGRGIEEWNGTKEVYINLELMKWIKSPHTEQYLVGNFT